MPCSNNVGHHNSWKRKGGQVNPSRITTKYKLHTCTLNNWTWTEHFVYVYVQHIKMYVTYYGDNGVLGIKTIGYSYLHFVEHSVRNSNHVISIFWRMFSNGVSHVTPNISHNIHCWIFAHYIFLSEMVWGVNKFHWLIQIITERNICPSPIYLRFSSPQGLE